MARFAHPLALHAVKQLAAEHGVCIRPLPMRRTELDHRPHRCDRPALRLHPRVHAARPAPRRRNGCGSSSAARAGTAPTNRCRRRRPTTNRWTCCWSGPTSSSSGPTAWPGRSGTASPASTPRSTSWRSRSPPPGLRGRVAPPRPEPGQGRRASQRRNRSTRRRQDAPQLPRRKVTARTIGRTFEGNHGRIFRPSTFITLTLDSLRPGAGRRLPGRPAQLRLPPGRLGRGALPGPAGPVLAEPAPGRGLERAVLRLGRTATPPRPARPLRRPRVAAAQGAASGRRSHLPPGVVALHRHRRLPRPRRPAGLAA